MSYMKNHFLLIRISIKSDLEIINVILDIFRYVVSASITGYLVLSYLEKLISTIGHFLAAFCWLVSVECGIISGI